MTRPSLSAFRSPLLIPLLVPILSVALAACTSPKQGAATSVAPAAAAPAVASSASSAVAGASETQDDGVAYFAGGCFWGVEHFLEQLDGVLSVESGYMGGHVEAPSYWQVASQTSGHLETVRVRFDPTKISYREVAKRFFEIHDPTQEDGQGPDLGPEYRSAVFYTSAEQKQVVEELIGLLRQRGFDVVTELRAAERFWEAEEGHQDYYEKTGKTPYCHARVRRFGD